MLRGNARERVEFASEVEVLASEKSTEIQRESSKAFCFI
jgi:hypothetical protein